MASVSFLWNYAPVFRPFSPIYNERVAVLGAPGFVSPARSSAVQRYGHQEAPVNLPGNTQAMFGGDFYNRFHVSAAIFTLGNLVGNQTRELRVWNGYRRARVLESLDLINGEGVLLSGQPDPPLQFGPQQERIYSIEISTEGPPTIEATLLFGIDEGESLSVLIVGSRVTPWPWQPNWATGVMESLEWMTEITETENASEQAIALRLTPRRAFEFTIGAEGRVRQAMEAAVAGWSGRVWAVPIWPDSQELAAYAPAGTTIIPVATLGRDFYEGGLAMFIGAGPRDFEVVEIEAVTAGQVVLKRPSVTPWPEGTSFYPARTARLDGGATFARFTGAMHTGRVRFELAGPCDWPELASMPTYRGHPVLEDQPEWSQQPTIAIQRKQAIVDNGYGKPEYTDRADIPMLRQAHRWSPVGRAQLARIRSLLYALRGKQTAIWVPSWAEDFTLAKPASSTGTSLDIDWIGYSLYLNGARNRRDVRIQTGSQIQYARIDGSAEVDIDTERLGIDAPLGFDLLPGQTTVQYLTLWRLDTDRLEWAWWSGDMGNDSAAADIPMPMRTFRSDI